MIYTGEQHTREIQDRKGTMIVNKKRTDHKCWNTTPQKTSVKVNKNVKIPTV